ncbi:MAG: cytochrome P450, partial [Pseudomonadota bacterium]
RDAFEEYARWISPIGMSPREVAQDASVAGHDLTKGTRVFLMFGSGNRDAEHFSNPDAFDLTQDRSAAISFGAGPHFCAGAWASKTLIGDVALPMFFEAFPKVRLVEDVQFGGWAFRGPIKAMVAP